MKISVIKIAIVALPLLFGACASKKTVIGDVKPTTESSQNGQSEAVKKLTFVQKVADNAVYAKNITSKIDFTINTGDKTISVDGTLRMRKDEVIRIQLAPFGLVEVGRVEFTPDYVLLIDRIHKEYIKADYNQVSFLQDNGLNFYSLQSLFWNQLFIPGKQQVSESSLKTFDVDLNAIGGTLPVMLNQKNLSFVWNADKVSGQISSADITYSSNSNGTSKVNWAYADFKSVGAKKFPGQQVVSVSTTALKKNNKASLTIKMKNIGTDSDWETQTTVSNKYKEVSVEDVLKKIMSL